MNSCMHIYIYICKIGLPCATLHARTHRAQDILSSRGFVRHLWQVMHLREGGLLYMAVVCSSWSVMCRVLPAYRGVMSVYLYKGNTRKNEQIRSMFVIGSIL